MLEWDSKILTTTFDKTIFLRLHTVFEKYRKRIKKSSWGFTRWWKATRSVSWKKVALSRRAVQRFFELSLLILIRFYSQRRKPCQIMIVSCWWYCDCNSLRSLYFWYLNMFTCVTTFDTFQINIDHFRTFWNSLSPILPKWLEQLMWPFNVYGNKHCQRHNRPRRWLL